MFFLSGPFLSYAPLKKKLQWNLVSKIAQNYLNYCTKLNNMIGDDKMTWLTFEKKSDFFFFSWSNYGPLKILAF